MAFIKDKALQAGKIQSDTRKLICVLYIYINFHTSSERYPYTVLHSGHDSERKICVESAIVHVGRHYPVLLNWTTDDGTG